MGFNLNGKLPPAAVNMPGPALSAVMDLIGSESGHKRIGIGVGSAASPGMPFNIFVTLAVWVSK
jgi:hypothetical protein